MRSLFFFFFFVFPQGEHFHCIKFVGPTETPPCLLFVVICVNIQENIKHKQTLLKLDATKLKMRHWFFVWIEGAFHFCHPDSCSLALLVRSHAPLQFPRRWWVFIFTATCTVYCFKQEYWKMVHCGLPRANVQMLARFRKIQQPSQLQLFSWYKSVLFVFKRSS